MDQRECHLQPLGICYKVYNFITKTLASQALKTVTLGRSTRCASSSIAPGDCSAEEDGDRKDQGSVMKGGETAVKNATSALPSASLPREAKPPKKMVSINEVVEEIPTKKIKKKRSKSFQKSSSRNEEEEEKEEPKPLKSILKVGSDVTEKSYFVS
ncbi:hypothetical protein PIB30_026375 [Stylosanthes scabra]|uniref:Uncharacterized protein n=1 Tax=Stylosanthes scabra TaxID=79078 RepID=A0ABU6QA14_9FABA|nr:hypothetical protein [Stylosanthes scabra]